MRFRERSITTQLDIATLSDIDARFREVGVRMDEIVSLAVNLIWLDSRNDPLPSREGDCKSFMHGFLRASGLESQVVFMDQAPGLTCHPLAWYRYTPLLGARQGL